MNKAELIEAVAKKSGLAARDAKAAIDAIFQAEDGVIAKALKKGDRVVIAGFGSFERRARSARKARNPQTGESIKIKARKVPAFKAGASLKETLK